MFRKGLRGYYPSLWERFKYNFGQGFKTIKSNYETWFGLVTKETRLSTVFFWHWLIYRPFEHPCATPFLPMKEYTWIRKFLEQEGFHDISIGGFAPFTIEATHWSGTELYFRSRGCTSLEAYIGDYIEAYKDNGMMIATIDIPGSYINLAPEAFQVFYYHYSDIKHIFEE